MKRIGILGGTFDPIHQGHLILAEQAGDGANLDQVVFMPARLSPFKINTKIASQTHRYAMVQAAIEGNGRFSLSDIELKGPEVSYTIDTLLACQRHYGPDSEICFLCGTDSFLSMESWKNAQSLFRDFTIIVGSRPRYKDRARDILIKKLCIEYNAKIEKILMPKIDISSTGIKKRLEEGRSIKYLVPAAVEQYIYEHGLYR